jgi:hypothetical protein
MAKQPKLYVITTTKGMFETRTYKSRPMTLVEAVDAYGYTLECGKSYEHEKGNKKINCNPKSIDTLIKNLNNAVNNSAANGYSGTYYSADEVAANALADTGME